MIFIAYEGDPADPLNQRMKVVEAPSMEDAFAICPEAFTIQKWEEPIRQDPPNFRKLERWTPVWSF